MSSDNSSDCLAALLGILSLPGIGPGTVRPLVDLKTPASFDSIFDAVSKTKKGQQLSSNDISEGQDTAFRIIDDCNNKDIQAIPIWSDKYPQQLLNIPDFPLVLYSRGLESSWSGVCVAVVGTREVSKKGASIAHRLGEQLAQRNVCVVSGLALGIDSFAHRGCVENEGTSIAVLAHGLHDILPATNRRLAYEILETGGALVSEHSPGTPAHRAEFVRRNRIQSGLSCFSIMVESKAKGGAIHEANFSHKQGRPVYVPFPPPKARGDLNTEGAEELIKTIGACPLTSSSDLDNCLAEAKKRTETDTADNISKTTNQNEQASLFDWADDINS